MKKEERSFVVVYGSAVKYKVIADETVIFPRDIDVVYGGKFSEADAVAYAKKWAEKKGLINLPVDSRRIYTQGNCVFLPAPCRKELLQYEVIAGHVKVETIIYSGFASYVRAFGNNAEEFVRQIKNSPFLQLGILPREWAIDRQWGDWDDYTQGLTALRSAVHHASDWKRIVESLPFGKILDRLVKENPWPIDKKFLTALRDGSPASSEADELFFSFKNNGWAITTKYEVKEKNIWSPEELKNLLWPQKYPEGYTEFGSATPDAPKRDYACSNCMVSWSGDNGTCPYCGQACTHSYK